MLENGEGYFSSYHKSHQPNMHFPTDDGMKYLRQQSVIKDEASEAAVDDDEAAQAAGE